ncbi:MAG: hypothetical protein ACOYJA_09710 [Christensenellales bacterium]|jgi:hypothetical protein
MASIKIKGLEKLQKQLKQMEKKAKALDGTHTLTHAELFSRSFMKKHSSFETMDELLKAGGFVFESQQEFDEAADAGKLDQHIAATTNFPNWSEMCSAAAAHWAEKQLGF